MSKNCIMFVCHSLDNFVREQLHSIESSVDADKYDLYVLMNAEGQADENKHIWRFNRAVAEACGFTMHSYYFDDGREFYGNNFEYSFMSFYLGHPGYDFYWLIEWDVYCHGSWNDALGYYDSRSKKDFLSTHIEIGTESEWQREWQPQASYFWIKSFDVPAEKRVKCFNPIDRFSNRALQCLCECYKAGDYGFYETVMPTIFYNKALSIANFDDVSEGGQGPVGNDSICWKKSLFRDLLMKKGRVYHPVKKKR